MAASEYRQLLGTVHSVCKRRDRRVFVGAMKNFKHISVRHEIFLKIFDGPQNIFLCSLLVILICKIRESESKMF